MKKAKKVFKWIGITFLFLLAVSAVFAFLGKKQTLALAITETDIAKIADGTYSGIYDCYRWSNTVEVTVKDHAITDIRRIKGPTGRENLVAELTDRVMQQQTCDVDVISGATADSKAFLKAVENALEESTTKQITPKA